MKSDREGKKTAGVTAVHAVYCIGNRRLVARLAIGLDWLITGLEWLVKGMDFRFTSIGFLDVVFLSDIGYSYTLLMG